MAFMVTLLPLITGSNTSFEPTESTVCNAWRTCDASETTGSIDYNNNSRWDRLSRRAHCRVETDDPASAAPKKP